MPLPINSKIAKAVRSLEDSGGTIMEKRALAKALKQLTESAESELSDAEKEAVGTVSVALKEAEERFGELLDACEEERRKGEDEIKGAFTKGIDKLAGVIADCDLKEAGQLIDKLRTAIDEFGTTDRERSDKQHEEILEAIKALGKRSFTATVHRNNSGKMDKVTLNPN
jgi:hypothetical protein